MGSPKKKTKWLDGYWLVALAALTVYCPFGVYTVTMFKTGRPLEGWLFEDVPGWGLGVVMLLGQAMVARAAITLNYAPTWVRAMFATVWAVVFACVQAVVPLALFAGSQGLSIPDSIKSLMEGGLLGAVQYGSYFALTLAAEGTVPALIIASRIEAQHAEEATAVQSAKEGKVLDTISDAVKLSNPDKLKLAIVQKQGQTNKVLAAKVGVTVSTLSKHAGDLKAEGVIHSRPSQDGVTWWLGREAA